MADGRRLCTFVVDGRSFGLAVERVQEVIRFQPMTRVPLAPPVVRGLINLRGRIVTAIDLRRQLGLEERPADALPVNVVLRADDALVSLLVDEIGDVIEAAEDAIERPPETLDGPARELVQGVCKLPDRLLLVLDADRAADAGAARGGAGAA